MSGRPRSLTQPAKRRIKVYMQELQDIADLVVGSSLAFSGLVLVFLGSVVAAFESYDATDQGAVRGKYRWRVWTAFAGFIFSLVAAVLSLMFKFMDAASLLSLAITAMGLAMVAVVVLALREALDIN